MNIWGAIAKYAVKVAVYAAGHPETVKGIVDAVAAVKAHD